MTYSAQVHAEPVKLNLDDGYAARGVALSRDAAHVVIAALRRDAYSMRARGGDFNREAADRQDALGDAIGRAL